MDCGNRLRICPFQYGTLEIGFHTQTNGYPVGLGDARRDSAHVRFRLVVGRSEFLLLTATSCYQVPSRANPKFERLKA
jgi:hypothetical protein